MHDYTGNGRAQYILYINKLPKVPMKTGLFYITEIYIYCMHDLFSTVSLLKVLSLEIHFCCV